ncbi:oxygenase MpaB family protein [Smaragdicoccus niigatensis]|uniref:oxygenase MpaB family protein n=1 Tax=Smaragdicoccus niigatensis TaxID=359359 RepID=UPI0003AA7430|nr:oxygenase MpaB family protein [Smaragdicoccus niigatensis]
MLTNMILALFRSLKLEVAPIEAQPMADYGYFGPGSVAWKVWGNGTTAVTGIQRAVVIEELDPNLIAAVDVTGANYDRPKTRYDRTVRYFAAVAFADSETVAKMADVLVKVHSKAIGIEPISGNKYDANNPESQLWILLTGWHSVLTAYEMYGGGKLTPEEERQYWEDCARAAEFQTCDPADVPRSSEGVREYFDRMRPRLAASEAAQSMMDHLLNAKIVLPELPTAVQPAVEALNWIIRAGAIATMPRWMRKLSGFDQPVAVDVMVKPVLRTLYKMIDSDPQLQLAIVGIIAPSAVPVLAPYLLGVQPRSTEVLTPGEGRRRYGFDKPVQAHLALRAKQHARVFADGLAPSDAGLIESQALLGRLG